jgi:copper(I)-binding protein
MMKRAHNVSLSWVVLAAVVAGCTPDSQQATTTDIEVSGVYVTEPAMGERAAMYFTVVNRTGSEDELISVATPVAEVAEMHKTVQQGGTVRMEPVGSLTLPANGELRFSPGGYHVMLLQLNEDFAPGDWVDATLHFRVAGDIAIRGEVMKYVEIEKALTDAQ